MKLRRVALGAVAAFALAATASSASAGGRGSLKDDEKHPFSWTGFYVGGLATYASGDSTHCDATCEDPGVINPKHEMGGWFGGVTAGYNVQMGRVVAGVEVDWSWGEAEGSSPDDPTFNCLGACATKVQSIGTIRGRLGYVFDRVLPYITAGVAITEQQASLGFISADRTVTSFVGGAGVEYAFAHKWSLKVEYLFIKADDKSLAYNACDIGCFANIDDIHTVRMGRITSSEPGQCSLAKRVPYAGLPIASEKRSENRRRRHRCPGPGADGEAHFIDTLKCFDGKARP